MEDDQLLEEEVDRTERSLDFQRGIHQTGGVLNEPGKLEFEIEPFCDRPLPRLGVHEWVYNSPLIQRGDFIAPQNILRKLEHGLRRVLDQFLVNVPDQKLVYFSIGSDRFQDRSSIWA